MHKALTGTMSIVMLAGTGAQTLPELARKQGGVEMVRIIEYPPTTVKQLVARSDAIIQARVLDRASSLSADQMAVITDDEVQVVQSFKGKLSGGARIKIRRPGGSVSIEGRNISMKGDPHLEMSQEYILFLRHDATTNTYSTLFGPQGALQVNGKNVAAGGQWGPEELMSVPPMSLDEFGTTISAIR